MNVSFQSSALKALDAKMAVLRGRGAQIAAEGIADAIESGNRRDRLAGVDRYGRPLAPLKHPRTGRNAGATGPPLAPHGSQSRSISAFRAEARRRGGNWQIVAGWVGAPWLAFHAIGAGRLPRRDLFGISPKTHAAIKQTIDAFVQKVLRAK